MNITFIIIHLADAFIQRDLQMYTQFTLNCSKQFDMIMCTSSTDLRYISVIIFLYVCIISD